MVAAGVVAVGAGVVAGAAGVVGAGGLGASLGASLPAAGFLFLEISGKPSNRYFMYSNLTLSKPDNTPAPATPRKMLAPAPLNKEPKPSLATTFWKQSKEEEYFSAAPEVIIIRRRMVSNGYEAKPAVMVTPQPNKKDAKKESLRVPVKTTGFKESKKPK